MSKHLLKVGFFLACMSLFAQTQAEKLQAIDAQIEELEEKKRGYEGAALRHENYAERQQFQDRVYLESRRHMELAEENRAKAQAVQQEIDALEKEKLEILKSKN